MRVSSYHSRSCTPSAGGVGDIACTACRGAGYIKNEVAGRLLSGVPSFTILTNQTSPTTGMHLILSTIYMKQRKSLGCYRCTRCFSQLCHDAFFFFFFFFFKEYYLGGGNFFF